MFQQIQGTVLSINSRETNGKFGPGYQFFIDLDVGGTTITFSTNGKKPNPSGKGSDGNWATITEGAQLHVLYTVSQCGNYNNSKASQITVLAPGNAPAAQPPRQPAPQAQGNPGQPAPQAQAQGSPAPTGKTRDIKSGRAVNVAATLVQAGIVGNVKEGLREAIRLEVLADTYYSRIYEEELANLRNPQGNGQTQQPVPQQPAPQPATQQQAAPQQPAPQPAYYEDDGFSDDIPF